MVRGWLRPARLAALAPHALIGLVVRPRCWLRGQHRWRVPNSARLAECSELVIRVRCADCGCQRTMRGGEIQHRTEREPVPHVTTESARRGSGLEQSGHRAVLQVARRRGYEDGLVAVGVPDVEAVRRAAERYP
jgi:hypothetical protein